MATFKEIKNKNGSITIKAYVRYKGVSRTQNFIVRGNNKISTKREAQTWANNLENEINSGTYKQEYRKHNYTVKEAIEKYINDGNPQKDESTRQKYIKALNWFKKEIGTLPIKSLTRTDLKQCRDKLLQKYKEIPIKGGQPRKTDKLISNSSINRYLAYFSTFLSYCVYEYEILENNPMLGAKLKLKENEPRKRWLSELSERILLLNKCRQYNYQLYLMVLIALTTGARNSEILDLTWENTDLENKAIYFKATKNGDDRTVAMPDILYNELKNFKLQNKIVNIKKDFLFKRKDGAQESGYLMEKVFPNIVEEAKIQKIGFYGLRHTYTSIGSLLGINTDIMDKITGHRNGRMTARYTHADCESLREPMNRVANYMFGMEKAKDIRAHQE